MEHSSKGRVLLPMILEALAAAPHGTDVRGFELGFESGREYQYKQIERVLCKHCMNGSPRVVKSGSPVHNIASWAEPGRITRITCDAVRIFPFRP